jgi:hypothetical protein
MTRRAMTSYSWEEQKLWQRFQRLLNWDDRPLMHAEIIDEHFPVRKRQGGKWRHHLWRGKELGDWFRTKESADWERIIVAALHDNGGRAHLNTLYSTIRKARAPSR